MLQLTCLLFCSHLTTFRHEPYYFLRKSSFTTANSGLELDVLSVLWLGLNINDMRVQAIFVAKELLSASALQGYNLFLWLALNYCKVQVHCKVLSNLYATYIELLSIEGASLHSTWGWESVASGKEGLLTGICGHLHNQISNPKVVRLVSTRFRKGFGVIVGLDLFAIALWSEKRSTQVPWKRETRDNVADNTSDPIWVQF